MTPKLYKATDVCELAQVQPYVLRSWEKEFPGIGVQRSVDSQRLYRQSDLDQVMRIKQLVFGEGLTLAGARRRLEAQLAGASPTAGTDDSESVLETLGRDARARIANVRAGLRSLLDVLTREPGEIPVPEMGVRGALGLPDEEYQLRPPTTRAPAAKPEHAKVRAIASRSKPARVVSKPGRSQKSMPARRKRADA